MTVNKDITDPQIRLRASRNVVEVINTSVSFGWDNQFTMPHAAIV